MNYLSICSGIEAASVAWHPLGWRPAGFAEIDPYCCHLLHKRYGASRRCYKALGNSMAVPVMHWIGERIQMVESLP